MTTRSDLIDQLDHLDIPERLTTLDLMTAARDAEILATRVRGDTAGVAALVNEVLNGQSQSVEAQMGSLRLLEEDFVADGGGFIALVVLIVLLYATNAY